MARSQRHQAQAIPQEQQNTKAITATIQCPETSITTTNQSTTTTPTANQATMITVATEATLRGLENTGSTEANQSRATSSSTTMPTERVMMSRMTAIVITKASTKSLV